MMDQARRVLCGVDSEGRSYVAADELTATRTVRPTGAVVLEVWRQERVPAAARDDGRRGPDLVLAPPTGGAVVRYYFDGLCDWCGGGTGYAPGQEWASVGAWYDPSEWGVSSELYVTHVRERLAARPWDQRGF